MLSFYKSYLDNRFGIEENKILKLIIFIYIGSSRVVGSLQYTKGRSGGAMILGKRQKPGRPTILMIVGQGPIALAVGAGGGCLDIFTLLYPFSSLPPSLWETARYRLKYCLKGPLNPKQPINHQYSKSPDCSAG